MLKFHWGGSLRIKFFRAVLGGVVIPMVIVGVWLSSTAGRSAEALLETRLDSLLDRAAPDANRTRASFEAAARTHSPIGVESLLALRPADVTGTLVAMLDSAGNTLLSTAPVPAALLATDRFALDGDEWLVRRKRFPDPGFTLVAAAPLGPYTAPFKRAARNGLFAILLVAGAALGLATLLTRRMARAMEALAIATDAVAAGDLDRRVSEERKDEVGRIGRSFNAMTESLRATVQKLSQREALVAVGEFAASLAHEVRNPLTSIRIDLQRVDEKLPADSPLRTHLDRALREVQRLDHTVAGALRIARSGSIVPAVLDLHVPLQRAIEVAAAAFEATGAMLEGVQLCQESLMVRGDESALEQLFLNILLNAAQSLGNAPRAGVVLKSDGRHAIIEIWDTGAGIPADQLDKVFEPFFSTKRDGTGLGLSLARQVVSAHGGTIAIASTANAGTTVSITIPLAG